MSSSLVAVPTPTTTPTKKELLLFVIMEPQSYQSFPFLWNPAYSRGGGGRLAMVIGFSDIEQRPKNKSLTKTNKNFLFSMYVACLCVCACIGLPVVGWLHCHNLCF